jgi:hypothetical protein
MLVFIASCFLATAAENWCDGKKFMIFLCAPSIRGGDDCGGAGDRFTGLISVFAFSVLTNRTFLADVDFLSDVFVPKYIDWRVGEAERRCIEIGSALSAMTSTSTNRTSVDLILSTETAGR